MILVVDSHGSGWSGFIKEHASLFIIAKKGIAINCGHTIAPDDVRGVPVVAQRMEEAPVSGGDQGGGLRGCLSRWTGCAAGSAATAAAAAAASVVDALPSMVIRRQVMQMWLG